MRYFIQLSYLGSAYCGWQVQPNGISVQEVLNQKLSILLKQNIETTGQGRTDAGVHAKKTFAHFDFEGELPPNFAFKLSQLMPYDIAIQKIILVNATAHARFDALSRRYEYIVCHQKNPFWHQRAMLLTHQLNYDAMHAACKILPTYTDFSCFSKSNTQVFTNNCTISEAKWDSYAEHSVFTIEANRFLRNMVRAIVGTMLEVGLGKIPPDALHEIIQSKNRSLAGQSVPACGLYLIDVKYPYSV